MKRALWATGSALVVFLAVLTLLAVRPIQKASAGSAPASKGCSNKTLLGTFGLVGTGFYLQDETNVPADVSGLVRFDGHGGFIATELNMVANGEALPGNPYEVPTGGATTAYSVNPDCSFTATISGQFGGSVTVTLWGIIINLTGTEITGNISSSNPNVTGTFHGTLVPPIASPPALI